VESRRKSKRQDKGKEVVVSEPVSEANSPITSFPPICTRPVQTSSGTNPLVPNPRAEGVRASSPPYTESLAQPPCAGDEHNHSPSKTNTLAITVGDVNMPGIPTPVMKVSAQSRVQTRS